VPGYGDSSIQSLQSDGIRQRPTKASCTSAPFLGLHCIIRVQGTALSHYTLSLRAILGPGLTCLTSFARFLAWATGMMFRHGCHPGLAPLGTRVPVRAQTATTQVSEATLCWCLARRPDTHLRAANAEHRRTLKEVMGTTSAQLLRPGPTTSHLAKAPSSGHVGIWGCDQSIFCPSKCSIFRKKCIMGTPPPSALDHVWSKLSISSVTALERAMEMTHFVCLVGVFRGGQAGDLGYLPTGTRSRSCVSSLVLPVNRDNPDPRYLPLPRH